MTLEQARAIETCSHPDFRDSLVAMAERDQAIRLKVQEELHAQQTPHQGTVPSGSKMREIDRENVSTLKTLMQEHGFPNLPMIGIAGLKKLWLLVQHADFDVSFQEECLAHFVALQEQELLPEIAYLTDRVRVHTGQKQLFGTQFWINPETNIFEPRPLEDPDTVDIRRASHGLGTLAEYTAEMNG